MITVNNLEYTYTNRSHPTLKKLNFHVSAGEVFGFLGPSGAGKSTTQKILIGLLKNFAGSVTVFEKPLQDWNESLYEKIGVSFEKPTLFNKLTAKENLDYFSRLYTGETRTPEEVLSWVDLLNDQDTKLEQFSKGMKNRLSVARAFIHKPELIFLDEPTSGLDPVNARKVKDLILEQKQQGHTIFLTTHDMTIADQLCDRVAFIVDGQINVIDAPNSLKQAYGNSRVAVEFGDSTPQTTTFDLHQLGQNPAFIELLHKETIRSIHSQDATLEDVFIQVTGRSLNQ
jgi:fluoroquinolone transport system ATP-binding protein